MEKNKNPRLCGICNRSFANGKAMGGHMRSHLLKLKLPLSPPTKRQLPTHSPTTRRSKRLRNSYSPSLSAQDAAICLLMLSRDHSQPNPDSQTEDYTTYESLDAAAANNGGAEDTENDECSNMSAKAHPKYYKCETCNRSFRSHQALGGHRASHSLKNKQILGDEDEDEDDDDSGDDDRRIHHQQRLFECPFCDKVFQSGQALGGHKKVHFAHLPVAHQDKPSVSSSSTLQLFDLNLPASTDDDDEEEEEEEAGLVANSAPSIYEQSG